jgi:hypothetical protein
MFWEEVIWCIPFSFLTKSRLRPLRPIRPIASGGTTSTLGSYISETISMLPNFDMFRCYNKEFLFVFARKIISHSIPVHLRIVEFPELTILR